MVYVFPLLVCPYANIVAETLKHISHLLINPSKSYKQNKTILVIEHLPLMPIRADNATFLTPFSYTSSVTLSGPNTLSETKKECTQIPKETEQKGRDMDF